MPRYELLNKLLFLDIESIGQIFFGLSLGNTA
jgi:hypothetical protein